MQRSHTEGQNLSAVINGVSPMAPYSSHLGVQTNEQSTTEFIRHKRNQQSFTDFNAVCATPVTSNLLNYRRLSTNKNLTFDTKKGSDKELQYKDNSSAYGVHAEKIREKDTNRTKDRIIDKTIKKQEKMYQKLEGWEIAYNNEHNFINQDSQKHYDVDHTIKKNLSHKRIKTESRLHSRNNRNRSTQFATGQFLKQIKLKYAKAVQQQKFDQQKVKIRDEFDLKRNQVILIDDENQNQNQYQNQIQYQRPYDITKNKQSTEDEQSGDNFVKYSQRKPFAALKKVTPNAHESLRNFKDINHYFNNLNERVNHDSLAPRPESKSKSRSRSSSKMNFTSSFEMKSKILAQKLKGDVKHITIDSSQLENMKSNQTNRKKTQYMGYQRLKLKNKLGQHPSHHIDIKLSEKGMRNLNSSKIQIPSKQSHPIKIKLKYLQSLKCHETSNLSTIEPETIERAKISPKQASLKHMHLQSFITINADNYDTFKPHEGSSKSHNLLTAAAWEANQNSARGKGKRELEDLKKLLKKEEDSSVYLLYNDDQNKQRFKSIEQKSSVRNKMWSDKRGIVHQQLNKQKNIKIKKGFSFKQVVDIF